MNQIQKSILPDHEEQFAKLFQHISDLITQDEIEEAAKAIAALHYADFADFLDNTNHRIHKKILPFLVNNIKPETLIWLSNTAKQSVIEFLGVSHSAKLISQLDIEDAIEVIDTIADEEKQAILDNINPEKKNQILEGFTYPENTVGRVVEKNFIVFKDKWTVEQAIESLSSQENADRDFHAAIIVDSKYRPVGNVLVSALLRNPGDVSLKKIMNVDLKVADPLTELDELIFIFKQYALTIVPVVNKSGKLIGIVSIDNMIYIIEQQAEKDVMQLGGVNGQDIFDNFFYTVKHRFPWLFVNLITTCITSLIINQFSYTIAKIITLAAIMPVVASMGGNAGTQAMTVTVRAIANKDINNANMLKIISKEIAVCGFNGVVLAIIGAAIIALLIDHSLGAIFAIAVVVNFVIAGFFGSMIPIALHQLNIDPATASGVFLTSITDAFGFFSFLTLAYMFMT